MVRQGCLQAFVSLRARPAVLLTGVLTAATTNVAAAQTAETVKLATYNVEHFGKMFDQVQMPYRSRNRTELFRDEEDLYEVARTIQLDRLDPDLLAIQECCEQRHLETFNQRWLGGKYAFVKVFPGNTDGQFLGVLAKPGFEPLAVKDRYYREADSVDNPALRAAKAKDRLDRGNLLFPRGPVFVKFRTPGGHVIWVGCTHVKSKYGNNEVVTRWRVRELQRTRAICGELLATGETDLLAIVGDFNDDFGQDRHEKAVGADAVATMLAGQGTQRLTCLTKPLVEADPAKSTYHCQIKPPTYRSFLDHIFVSPALARAARQTYVVDDPIAAAASDHYPVVSVFSLPRKP